MLVLSGVFNTRIFDTTNYANQDYMLVNYILILIVVYSMLLVTGSQSKKHVMFLPGYGLHVIALCNAIYWSNMGFSVLLVQSLKWAY
jgi:hypothetical protein